MNPEDNHDNHSEQETGPTTDPDLEFHTELSEDLYQELVDTVEGERVVGMAIWESSLADEEGQEIAPEQRDIFDLDLYLENHTYLELYGVYVHTDPMEPPLRGLDRLGTILSNLVEQGVWLDEIATTEDNELVLILARHREPQLYLNVGGWSLEEWDRLPDEEA